MATFRLSLVALLVGSLTVSAQEQTPAPEVFGDAIEDAVNGGVLWGEAGFKP